MSARAGPENVSSGLPASVRACHEMVRIMLSGSLFDRPRAVTRLLLALCIADFVLMSVVDRRIPFVLFGGSGTFGPPTIRSLVLAGGIFSTLVDQEPYRLLSAVYVHLGLDHLALNMAALVSLGRSIEDRIGGARLLLLFVVTGILGFAVSRFYYGQVSPPTAGASGALFGFVGHDIGVLLSRRDPRAKELILQQLAYAVGFALLFSVNNAAHAGGFLAGIVLGYLFEIERHRLRHEPLFRSAALLCIALSILSVVLSVRSVLSLSA
ncbi:MAG: hypothetical protein B6A08_13350 [Sorangiineae bacterium NIC37A_2]|jgi:membrane associated rhomboid family serine protease|nr:MAG: hypothetical protein B6A08_13350 [Sorangiineae bacterium NIC37A_2]